MTELTTTRSNALIDPHLQIWHVEIPLYLFLGGLVAGLMVLAGLWALRRPAREWSRALALLPWAGPNLLSAGMFFLWLDLEHPFNAWRFYLVWKLSSPMSWGAWILLLVYPVAILLAWAVMPEGTRRWWAARLSFVPFLEKIGDWAIANTRSLAFWNIGTGAALGVYTGVLLGTMQARPLWNSAILGPLFLASGLSTGAAFLLLYRLSREERVALGRLDMGLIVAELVLLGLWILGLATGGAAAREAVSGILGGPWTALFWTLVVALGLLTPLVAEWLEHRHGLAPGRLAAVFVLIGGFALRWILVYAGQASGWVSDVAVR